ncbi:MAG: copper homeostasis protein CutC [Promethearchaeota archaeon]
MAKLEIIVDTWQDALAAEAGGATQLDLKADFPKGGVTQSAGMIEKVCNAVQIPVMVIIRPHARYWRMTNDDIIVMCSDIGLARKLGAEHFLLGCLDESGEIDIDAFKVFLAAAKEGTLHCHLAWELTPNPLQTLDILIELGVKSVRTTGGGGLLGKAEQNIEAIRIYAAYAQDRIDLFLAGGVNAGNVETLISKTGLTNVHVGSGVREPETPDGIVLEDNVRRIRQAVDRAEIQLDHQAN